MLLLALMSNRAVINTDKIFGYEVSETDGLNGNMLQI